jgi:hypothetical protein
MAKTGRNLGKRVAEQWLSICRESPQNSALPAVHVRSITRTGKCLAKILREHCEATANALQNGTGGAAKLFRNHGKHIAENW